MSDVGRAQALDAYSPEYWLAHCEGFCVDDSGGRIGIVEEVRLSASGVVEGLVVGVSRRGRAVFVAIGDVAVVQPGRERVALAEGAKQESLADLSVALTSLRS